MGTAFRLAIALVACSPLGAQGAGAFTSPRDFESREANAATTLPFGTAPQRLRQIDGTHVGLGATTVTAMAWRRNAVQPATAPAGGTADLGVWLFHSDIDPLSFRAEQGIDPLPPAAIQAFVVRPIQFPDWSAAPATPPAPFDFRIPLDVPFAYDGVRNLGFETHWSSWTGTASNVLDRHYGGPVVPYTESPSTSPNVGCATRRLNDPFVEAELLARNSGPSGSPPEMALVLRSLRGLPPGSAVLMNVDTQDADLTLPGLCTSVHSLGAVGTFLMGTVSSFGVVLGQPAIRTPYAGDLEGMTFVTQCFAFDPSQAGIPISLANAQITTMPAAPPVPVRCAYVYGLGAVGTGVINAGVITLFEH